MDKISVKVTIIYILLWLFNISFFTVVIFENQIDLITDNSKYQAKELAESINNTLTKIQDEINQDRITYNNESSIVTKFENSIDKIIDKFLLYKESGEILSNKGETQFEDEYKNYATKAFTNKDFLGQPFYTMINDKKMEILFFMPLSLDLLDNSVLFFKYKISDIGKRLEYLYKLIFIVIFLLTIFHIIFGIVINKIIIKPIKFLHRKSVALGRGDLSARVRPKNNDEIGQLSKAFNEMATSIQKKIVMLQSNERQFMEELQVASEVQSTIFPKIESLDNFDLALFHKPLELVSGDYYDYKKLEDGKTCFFIADICGHGVPAALITMLVKEIFQTSLKISSEPKDLFEMVNDRIYDLINEYSAFFTAFYILVDQNNNLCYVSGGHPPALLFKQATNEVIELNTEGFVLGMMREMYDVYNCCTDRLEANDKIILYTDGITEAKNGSNKLFSLEILKDTIAKNGTKNSKELLKEIVMALNDFMGDKKLQDDATIFVVGVN